MQKIVFPRSRTDLCSTNARLISSGNLTHSCLEAGLVDEVVMTLNPVLLGAGTPMFPPGMSRTDLQLRETAPFAIGSVGFHYPVVHYRVVNYRIIRHARLKLC